MMYIKSTALATVLLLSSSNTHVNAFGGAPMKSRTGPFGKLTQSRTPAAFQLSPSFSATTQLSATSEDSDSEVDRLRSMAAKLRAEAAALEAEKFQERADATKRAFAKFDTDGDGEITLEELKAGLEKALKTELKEDRVKQLMIEFDASGDGALQPDEFVTVDKFRNRLEGMVREEQDAAREAKRQAKLEGEAAQLAEAKANMLNDGEPSQTDKLVSIIPYLLPLLDGLAFGRFLLEGQENPAVAVLAVLFTLYRSIPFSGFVAFLALSTLSGNFNINRLVRFNMQQAIYLDIALFVPGLIASLYTLVGGSLGVQVPENITQLGSDGVFVLLLATIGYSVVSSLLGIAPDKIPILSEAVNERMPSLDMFDDEGRFIPPTPEDDSKKDDEEKK